MKGALAFDAMSMVQDGPAPTSLPPETDAPAGAAPRAWRHGMELLSDRRLPRGATQQRWDQIIRDCWAIIANWSELVIEAGCSIENIFGFDPDGGSYDYGLAVALRGGRLIGFNDGHAVIRKSGPILAGERPVYLNHHPRLAPGAPLLWTFNERKL